MLVVCVRIGVNVLVSGMLKGVIHKYIVTCGIIMKRIVRRHSIWQNKFWFRLVLIKI
jgi:hypothetical protein